MQLQPKSNGPVYLATHLLPSLFCTSTGAWRPTDTQQSLLCKVNECIWMCISNINNAYQYIMYIKCVPVVCTKWVAISSSSFTRRCAHALCCLNWLAIHFRWSHNFVRKRFVFIYTRKVRTRSVCTDLAAEASSALWWALRINVWANIHCELSFLID